VGDGVLVYFGYPQAHEDDAERAVRVGPELIGAVSALKSNALLQTRVGIATGIVVVGELIGSGGIVGPDSDIRVAQPVDTYETGLDFRSVPYGRVGYGQFPSPRRLP
jgi:hypothetical protein